MLGLQAILMAYKYFLYSKNTKTSTKRNVISSGDSQTESKPYRSSTYVTGARGGEDIQHIELQHKKKAESFTTADRKHISKRREEYSIDIEAQHIVSQNKRQINNNGTTNFTPVGGEPYTAREILSLNGRAKNHAEWKKHQLEERQRKKKNWGSALSRGRR